MYRLRSGGTRRGGGCAEPESWRASLPETSHRLVGCMIIAQRCGTHNAEMGVAYPCGRYFGRRFSPNNVTSVLSVFRRNSSYEHLPVVADERYRTVSDVRTKGSSKGGVYATSLLRPKPCP